MRQLDIALFTYSTKPRGGVVHTLNLAEKLRELGQKVHIYALGTENGFFRKVDIPHTLVPCPKNEFGCMDEKIHAYIRAYVNYLSNLDERYDIYHAEDCISANALLDIRQKGRIEFFLRTVHHVDDFRSESLLECQMKSIMKPDYLLVVSNYWEKQLAEKYSLRPRRVTNGVELSKFYGTGTQTKSPKASKLEFSADGCKTVLTIGGIEPRKNTLSTLRAFARAREHFAAKNERVIWLLGGGETLFDYRDYRREFFSEAEKLEIKTGKDIFILGRVPEELIADLYNAADVFIFPSLTEGWGLVVLEAMASGVPVIASNIEPLTEFMENGKNSLLVSPMDYEAIANGIIEILEHAELRKKLIGGGTETARQYGWESVALEHLNIYSDILNRDVLRTVERT
ncbi:MAG: MSMEG_0565 family glycosyltransferase [Candidatus Dadabacteria bacterium]|nr:MSMEG_0565 family glycosyltransferase [Candidatus Dadabacteria bacterium]MCY4261915.1 MSMEG_0565 family glycosyltransferase [Candidatus Dadabacteria bacterium]